MELGLLTKDVLFVLVFLIPGYIGFRALLGVFTKFFPAFRYRNSRVSPSAAVIGGIVWSAFIYYGLFKVGRFEEITSSIDVPKFAVMILVGLALACVMAFVFALIVYGVLLLGALVIFALGKTPEHTKLPYFSWKRLTMLLNQAISDYDETFSDELYLGLVRAAQKRKHVKIFLRLGAPVEGLILEDDAYDVSEIRVKDGRTTQIVRLEDIAYLEIKNS